MMNTSGVSMVWPMKAEISCGNTVQRDRLAEDLWRRRRSDRIATVVTMDSEHASESPAHVRVRSSKVGDQQRRGKADRRRLGRRERAGVDDRR